MLEIIIHSAILGSLGIIAGVLGGVIGFGTTIILMPALVYFYGPMQTIPIVAITATVANLTRIFIWWKVIDWRVCAVYGLAGIPAVVLGANTLVSLNESVIQLTLGLFLLLLIPIRRWMRKQRFYLKTWHMIVVGAFIGYLTGIVATTGALNTPFFLAYGLTKGAFLGTEAASTLAILFAKGITFHQLGLLNVTALIQGLLIGSCVMLGSLISKRIVLALPEERFMQLMELVMLASGLAIILMAL